MREGFEATKREGLNSFGDDRVFIEKFTEDPRHIETNLGDMHGTILYLNERECSIRAQKVVEEAPSPFVTPKMRKAMGEQCRAGRGGGLPLGRHRGADRQRRGRDWRELLLRNEHPPGGGASGDRGDHRRGPGRADDPRGGGREAEPDTGDIGIDGWAIENRVYAEDPYRGFLPSIGRLVRYEPPLDGWTDDGSANGRRGVDGVRVDDGVYEGGEVSMFYDPMIAKLVTWGETRDEAADLQVQALDSFRIEGLGHNVDFLSAIMQHPRFRAGELTTGFTPRNIPTASRVRRWIRGFAAFWRRWAA